MTQFLRKKILKNTYLLKSSRIDKQLWMANIKTQVLGKSTKQTEAKQAMFFFGGRRNAQTLGAIWHLHLVVLRIRFRLGLRFGGLLRDRQFLHYHPWRSARPQKTSTKGQTKLGSKGFDDCLMCFNVSQYLLHVAFMCLNVFYINIGFIKETTQFHFHLKTCLLRTFVITPQDPLWAWRDTLVLRDP